MQGVGKFGFYELFKEVYSGLLNENDAYKHRTAIYLAASASAEFFADIFLCPMETIKVKMQTSDAYPSSFSKSMSKLAQDEGRGALIRPKVLTSLWGRQIPYTMMKFSCFERTIEAMYQYVLKSDQEKCSKSTRLGVTVASGYIAGIFCAVVSHPADVLVSILNTDKSSKVVPTIKRIGLSGLYKGLSTRILMIGTLTSAQFFIYDGWKTIFNLPTKQIKMPAKKIE